VLRNRKFRFPEFPVEVGGVGELHAAFLDESRTSGRFWRCVTGNSGFPNFLSRLVALANFMRLSLTKAAQVVVSGAA
jgi:dihydroorotase-like cyclic amidohydrolase